VYTAGLLVESASRLADPKSEIGSRLEKSVLVLNDAIADLRRNLSELHADSTDSVESLPSALRQIASNPNYASLVNIKLEIILPEDATLPPIRSSHVLAIVNEALANTVRHAQAKNVEIQAQDLDRHLHIVIRDDGVGFPAEPKAGLRFAQHARPHTPAEW
jgi:signal transduction histidine kinase